MKKMNKKIIASILVAIWIIAPKTFSQEYQKLAQTGFQFLSVVSDAKATAMGDAMTSLQIGSSALFFNPAGMAEMEKHVDVTASSNQWIADITHSTYSVAVKPGNGNWGVMGLSFQSVDYGEFYGTRVDKSSDKGYVDTGMFSLSAMAMGVGYAKQLTDRFSVGGQIRYVEQDLGESIVPGEYIYTETDTTLDLLTKNNTNKPLAYDFGTQFKTGFHSLVFGMSVRNFSSEIKYVEEGFQLPLVFNLGISMNLMDFFQDMPLQQSLYASIDASHYRSHPEQIKLGFDYRLMNALSLRCGYVSNNDQDGFSYGIGVSSFGLAFDYAYTPFGVFGDVTKMTVRFSL